MRSDVLKSEVALAAALIERVNATFGEGDDDLAHDTIEGQTGLFEAMDAALRMKRVAEGMAAGIKAEVKLILERAKRHEARAEAIDLALRAAFEATGLPKLERPMATFSWSNVAPSPRVTDADAVPAEYRRSEPNLSAIKDAIKSGVEIPGVTMSNGGRSVRIRES